MGKLDLRHEAVADKRFKEIIGQGVKQEGTSLVKITKYEPNQLTYEVESQKGEYTQFLISLPIYQLKQHKKPEQEEPEEEEQTHG